VSEQYVFDASAILCLLHREPGWEVVARTLPLSCISAVNLAEVVAKLNEGGMEPEIIDQALAPLQLRAIAFDADQAHASGRLRRKTRAAGLSLGDRACLALAARIGATALTADRAWPEVEVGVRIELIR
jgi:PIN domain nuclease of toxin-antitoxin system